MEGDNTNNTITENNTGIDSWVTIDVALPISADRQLQTMGPASLKALVPKVCRLVWWGDGDLTRVCHVTSRLSLIEKTGLD